MDKDIPECQLEHFKLFSQPTDLQCPQYTRLIVNSFLDNTPIPKSTN